MIFKLNRFFLLGVSLLVFSGAALAGDDNDNTCGILSVLIVNTTKDTCKLIDQRLNHGYVIGNTHIPVYIPPNSSAPALELIQSRMWGPEIILTYRCGEGRLISLNTRQNFCLLSAGRITGQVTDRRGMTADYTAKEGSYFWNQHGTISWALQG